MFDPVEIVIEAFSLSLLRFLWIVVPRLTAAEVTSILPTGVPPCCVSGPNEPPAKWWKVFNHDNPYTNNNIHMARFGTSKHAGADLDWTAKMSDVYHVSLSRPSFPQAMSGYIIMTSTASSTWESQCGLL